jgi:hypothetical protein
VASLSFESYFSLVTTYLPVELFCIYGLRFPQFSIDIFGINGKYATTQPLKLNLIIKYRIEYILTVKIIIKYEITQKTTYFKVKNFLPTVKFRLKITKNGIKSSTKGQEGCLKSKRGY